VAALALNHDLPHAVEIGKRHVTAAIMRSYRIGKYSALGHFPERAKFSRPPQPEKLAAIRRAERDAILIIGHGGAGLFVFQTGAARLVAAWSTKPAGKSAR